MFNPKKIRAANSLLKFFCFSINRSLEVNKVFPGDGPCIQGEELPNIIILAGFYKKKTSYG